jgi:hypothetical protein
MDRLTQYIDANLKLKARKLYFFSDDHLAQADKYLSEIKGVRFKVKSEKDVKVSATSFPEPWPGCNAGWLDCSCEAIGECWCSDCGNEMPIDRHYLTFSWGNEFMDHEENCYDDSCIVSRVFVYHTVTLVYKDLSDDNPKLIIAQSSNQSVTTQGKMSLTFLRETDQGQVYRSIVLISGSARFDICLNRKLERILVSRIKKFKEGKSDLKELVVTVDDEVELVVTETDVRCKIGVYSNAEIRIDFVTKDERDKLLDILVEGH